MESFQRITRSSFASNQMEAHQSEQTRTGEENFTDSITEIYFLKTDLIFLLLLIGTDAPTGRPSLILYNFFTHHFNLVFAVPEFQVSNPLFNPTTLKIDSMQDHGNLGTVFFIFGIKQVFDLVSENDFQIRIIGLRIGGLSKTKAILPPSPKYSRVKGRGKVRLLPIGCLMFRMI